MDLSILKKKRHGLQKLKKSALELSVFVHMFSSAETFPLLMTMGRVIHSSRYGTLLIRRKRPKSLMTIIILYSMRP